MARVDGSKVLTGLRNEIVGSLEAQSQDSRSSSSLKSAAKRSSGKEVVSMQNVNVRYEQRHVRVIPDLVVLTFIFN